MHVTHQGQGHQARDARATLPALARLPLQGQRAQAPRHTRHCPAQVQNRNIYQRLFWHGHEDCRYFVLPKSNSQFWQQKIERNKQRDIEKRIQLRLLGWHTIIIWGCELMPKNRHTTLQALEQTLNKIYLLNNSVEVTASYPVVEDTTGMVAEGGK